MKNTVMAAIFLTVLMTPLVIFAAKHDQFIEGKQFKPVMTSASNPMRLKIPENKIVVVEFFSYGCPSCFNLEPTLEKWLKTKPADVEFKRIPVAFEQGWDMYSKAYYTADALGILPKISPALFNAVQRKGEDLTSLQAMQQFFMANGVSKKDFKNTFIYSPGIDMALQRSKNLMTAYQINDIPTIVVNGKYYTTIELAKGNDQRMMQIVSFLISKEKNKRLST